MNFVQLGGSGGGCHCVLSSTGNLVPISRFTLSSNMTGHRKKPFSGKAKKAQLQARKARKAARQGAYVCACDQ